MAAVSWRIRWAGPSDSKEILRLNLELACYHNDQLSKYTLTEKELQDELKEAHPVVKCLVVEPQPSHNGELIGIALVHLGFSCEVGRRLFLNALYIQDKYRGHGIGKALMRKLAKYAKEQQCTKISWAAKESNKTAVTFYSSLGAKPAQWKNFSLSNEHILRLAEEDT